MNIDACVTSLSLPLPEDILKRKWAGDVEGAIRAIDLHLANDPPAMLRDRLTVERERLRRLPTQYPWNRAEALEKLRALAPEVTDEQLCRMEDAGLVDFIYLKGEKRYFVRFHRSLCKLVPELTRGEGKPNGRSPYLDPMIAEMKRKGFLRRRLTLDVSLSLAANAFTPGEYLAHLPYPAVCAQQSDVRLLEGDPDGIAPADAPARTAWWRRKLDAWQDFRLRYSYVSCVRYADPLHAPAPEHPLYPDVPAPSPEDLSETLPYLRFTPYLRALAAELAGNETDNARKAWKFYEFVTTKVKYSFMRDYFQIDDLGEYCAVNLKGDCGLQALLFIELCRIAGIPARWQSGMSVSPDYVGSHDWAQFYLEGWGWLLCDPSFGGSAWRGGAGERHAFYFGNLDPMRMVANCRFQASLTPEKSALRVDPYDNQSGELERAGAEVPFTGRDLDGDAELVSYEELDEN